MRAALESLIASPVRLVLAVAIVAGLPRLAIGELSAGDTRDRIRADQLRAAAEVAQHAADGVSFEMSSVRVESEVGSGSTFTFTLPVAVAPGAGIASAS